MRIIVIGAGEVGFHIAERLADEKNDVVVIDTSAERLKYVQNSLDLSALTGSGSSPMVLKEAGINEADMVVAVTDSDEINMIACLIAGSVSSSITRIARIRNLEYLELTDILGENHLGIDLAINPELEAARQIQRLFEVPAADKVFDFGNGLVRLLSIEMDDKASIFGIELRYLKELQPSNGILLTAIEREGRVLIPHGRDQIQPGDTVWFMIEPSRLDDLLRTLEKPVEKISNLIISGGGIIGYYLARELEAQGVQIKLIEADYDRCAYLADNLEHTVVLHGSAIDQNLLEEENAGEAAAFVAVTDDDENNILSTLLAKQLGVPWVVTLANKRAYIQVVSAIGVDRVVSRRMAAVDKILQFIRKGNVLGATSLEGLDVELLEFGALDTSDVVGRQIKDLKIPEGAIFGAIVRGDQAIIPSGNDVVMPGDRITIFAKRKSINKLEKLFAVKPEFF